MLLNLLLATLVPYGTPTTAPQGPQHLRARAAHARSAPQKRRLEARRAPGALARPQDELRGVRGEYLGTDSDVDLTLGGNLANPFGPRRRIRPAFGSGDNIYEVTLDGTGTGWQETFLIGAPTNPLPSAPLLVIFHAYARTPLSVVDETDYFQLAMDRGWYVMAPLGAHKFNFSIPYAQENVAFALDWAVQNLILDTDRIYGIGFSMGGGMATTFAARHQDPTKPRFAAVVDHTGTVSIRDEWNHAFDTSVLEHEQMFGGGPETNTFLYQQASTIDLFPNSSIDQDTDFARNLRMTPTLIWSVAGDPLGYLVDQSDRLQEQLVARGGTSTRNVGTGTLHAWMTLDETAVLDFFDPLRLATPEPNTQYETLIDRGGRWHDFDILQSRTGEFSTLDWRYEPASNRIVFQNVSNVARVSFDARNLSLNPTLPLNVSIATQLSEPVAIEVRGYANLPSSIQRNSQSSASWSYDTTTGSVFLVDFNATTARNWQILP